MTSEVHVVCVGPRIAVHGAVTAKGTQIFLVTFLVVDPVHVLVWVSLFVLKSGQGAGTLADCFCF